jgi:hypothetical protein
MGSVVDGQSEREVDREEFVGLIQNLESSVEFAELGELKGEDLVVRWEFELCEGWLGDW